MQIYNQIKQNIFPGGSSIALGVFDGVHLGHAQIIKNAVIHARKSNLTSVVATFTNHPHSEITGQAPKLLCTFEEKVELIKNLGIDIIFALDFNSKLRHMSAQEYFSKILIDCLCAKYISIGFDHKFGFNQEGSPDKLKEWSRKLGVVVHVNHPVNIHDEPVSSTRIRKDIAAGQIKSANLLLGRYYSLTGKVTQGIKRGTTLGFPTANVMVPGEIVVPLVGVYVGYATILEARSKETEKQREKDARLPCVINIGHCPTFKEETSELKIEAYILNFSYQELYNKEIKIEFVDRLRDEQKFNSKEELTEQIKKDCEIGKKVLSS